MPDVDEAVREVLKHLACDRAAGGPIATVHYPDEAGRLIGAALAGACRAGFTDAVRRAAAVADREEADAGSLAESMLAARVAAAIRALTR